MDSKELSIPILDRQIIQVNPLIEARKCMNLSELRLFCLGLQDVHPKIKNDSDSPFDVEFRETFITHKELLEIFNNNPSGVENLKRHVKKAFDAKIEIKIDNKGSFMLLHLYKKLLYIEGVGLVIKFDDEMKKYMLDLIGQAYTTYAMKTTFPLTSTYAWRIMELMLQKKGHFKAHDSVYRIMTIDKIRFYLNIKDGLYESRIDNFRRFVLDDPIKEINEKTEYTLWYDVIKTGRKIIGFKLWMKKKYPDKKSETKEIKANQQIALLPPTESANEIPNSKIMTDKDDLKSLMRVEGFKLASINSWIKKYGVTEAKTCFELAQKHADQRAKTKIKGSTQRMKYIHKCMEINITTKNAKDKKTQEEIKKREKELESEKQEKSKKMRNGFAKTVLCSATTSKHDGEAQTIGAEKEKVWWRKYTCKGMTVAAMRAFNDGMSEAEFLEQNQARAEALMANNAPN